MGGDLKQEGQGPVAGVGGFDLGRWGRVGKGREMRREDRKEGCWPYKGTWGRTSCEGCGGKGAGQRVWSLALEKGIGASCWQDDHSCCPGEVGPALGCEESGRGGGGGEGWEASAEEARILE